MNLLYICVTLGIWLTLACGEEVPIVSTEEGKVSGIVEEATNGNKFYSYYGIPYATPPLAELRFKDPVVANSWKGVRDGSSMPSPCLQLSFGAMLMGIEVPPEDLNGDEDCLYLNVFTPKVAHLKENLPVMVFIHGGAFFSGAANEYLPHVLLNKDIVLVVIQYRLGFLGFLSTEDSVIPGNYGLKDQNLALHWVQKNIRSFGGNPQRVTIFGESAGAASVHFHMLSPKATGLFSGAIMQSGNALCPWGLTGEHWKNAKTVGSSVGCSIEEGSYSFLICMQSASPRKINAAMQHLFQWLFFPLMAGPRVDGDYVPDHPAQLMQDGRYNKVPLMTGVTAHEAAVVTLPMFIREDVMEKLLNNFSVIGPATLHWYSFDDDPIKLSHKVYNYYIGGNNLGLENAEDFQKMMTDQHFNFPHDLISQLNARETGEGVSTFRYELTHRSELSLVNLYNSDIGRHWVCHVDDLFYLFRGGPMLQPTPKPPHWPVDLESQVDLNLRNTILTLWTNFATGGHPTPDKSLGFLWDATSPDDLRHLSLSPAPAMTSDSRKEVREFLCSLPTKINRLLHPDLVREDESSTGSTWANQDEL